MAVAPPPAARAPGPRSAGTRLDERAYRTDVPMPGARSGLLLFVLFAVVYFVIGYRVTIDGHVVVFDALNRLTNAYLVWWNDPPKLAAIGFLFPPLTTLALLPLTVVKPVATSLVALPLATALAAAGAMVWLDRALARCEMPALLRLPLLAAFGLNPLWVFYAGNGMSEALYLALLAVTLYAFVSWYETSEPRYLFAAGFAIALLVMTRYSFGFWAAVMALLIGIALHRRRAGPNEIEGSVVAFAAPVVYALAIWILFNGLIVGDPLGWVLDQDNSTLAVNSSGVDVAGTLGVEQVSERLLELNVAVFPLAFVVVPGLVIAFVTQRNDMALWLASFLVLGIVVMGAHALLSDDESLLTLRDAMPMALTALVGAAWIYRSANGLRTIVWLATFALLLVNLFTAWDGMRNYPFQSLEQAFTRTVFSGESQEGRSSRGGFTVGIDPEAQMAEYVKENITARRAILADNAQTFGVILLSGRPALFFDRIDEGDGAWKEILDDPWGEIPYVMAATGARSGDQVLARYPGLADGTEPGMTVVARTDRYVLARVAERRPQGAG
ncbi:MAG TPA: hypothetical protein VNZ62_10350 [Capillimicrobium sp.]|nr:hypothetical protein [Capillimicrobium sp.]